MGLDQLIYIPGTKNFHLYIFTISQVRYAVVVVLREVYSRLGNEFMTLLPETIPFLAELLEGIIYSSLEPLIMDTNKDIVTCYYSSKFTVELV